MSNTQIEINLVTDRRTLVSHTRYLSSLLENAATIPLGIADIADYKRDAEYKGDSGDAALFILDQSAWIRSEIRSCILPLNQYTVFWSPCSTPETELAALDFGARGILNDFSSDDEFVNCVRTVLDGGRWIPPSLSQVVFRNRLCMLTRRESEITKLVTQGLANKEISASLKISEGTVKIYLSRLFDKLGVADRYELALVGLRSYGITSGMVGREREATAAVSDGTLLRRVLAPDRVWRPNRQTSGRVDKPKLTDSALPELNHRVM